jgi:hypothetical protein
MRHFQLGAFLVLVVATILAFFIAQHLKVSAPYVTGITGPAPAEINPLNGRSCYDPAQHARIGRTTRISFYLLHASDEVDVYIVNQSGTRTIATIAHDRFMKAVPTPHQVPRAFNWNGREQNGSIAPDGTYYFDVHLVHQDRTVTIADNSGPLPVRVSSRARCP